MSLNTEDDVNFGCKMWRHYMEAFSVLLHFAKGICPMDSHKQLRNDKFWCFIAWIGC